MCVCGNMYDDTRVSFLSFCMRNSAVCDQNTRLQMKWKLHFQNAISLGYNSQNEMHLSPKNYSIQ